MKTSEVEHGAGPGPDALLTVDDVLREIPTSRSAFAVLRQSGDFPQALKLAPRSRRLFFRAGDVRAWLATRQRV